MIDSIEDFTGGEPAAADQLRRSLRILRDHYPGTPLARQIADVLAGRMDFRSLARDPEFASLAHDGMRKFGQEWESKSAAEREALVREGESFGAAVDEELNRRGS
jgi:hypothetical protein